MRYGTSVAPASSMTGKSKLIALGAAGACGIAAFGIARALKRRSQLAASDPADLDEPVIVTEEVVVIGDPVAVDLAVEVLAGDITAEPQR
jgi:hypothetical protein